MSTPKALHLDLFTELLVLFMVLFSLFGAQLQSFGIPTVVVQALGGAYLALKYLLPQLPAVFQVNTAEADLQAQLTTLASTLDSHSSQIDQIHQLLDQAAKSVPQNTQPATPAPTLPVTGGVN